MTRKPPMKESDEATEKMLKMAREQGEALSRALHYMIEEVATDGAVKAAGDYKVAFAVEEAEGMWHREDGELVWRDPDDENCHVEIGVIDGADGRFIPGLGVFVTMTDADGNEVGSHKQPFLWHPWLYHYGRNWKVPGDGTYNLHVRIEPPEYARHDRKNGKRFAKAVEVTFENIQIETGQD